jgi:glycosyltransferase involved in cell wall biosynthesis
MIKASVIICSHDPRPAFLQRALGGLQSQTLPREQWELLLIDNASKISLAENFDLSWHAQGRHVRENELGLTHARLRGIRESRADILIFVDDDNVLAADYLEQALNVGEAWPFVGVWGGSCHGEYEIPLPAWVGDQLWRLAVVEVKEDVWSNLREGFLTAPCGAGMCVRKKVCAHFLERCRSHKNNLDLGRKGTILGGYEDMEIVHCAFDLGMGAGKSTKLHLTHIVPASRLTVEYFVRQTEGDATSLIAFQAARGLRVSSTKPMTLFGRFRWWLYRLRTKMPREEYEIHKAYNRGLLQGIANLQKQSKETDINRNIHA